MAKNEKIVFYIIISFSVIILSFILYVTFFFRYHLDAPQKTVLKNTKSGRKAVLLRHGMLMGSRISLLVEDNDNYIWIGTVDADDSLTLYSIYWSRDGSVIASNSKVMICKENNGFMFTHAYDFINRTIYKPDRHGFDNEADWIKLSKQIKSLLDSRGGIDKEIKRESLHKTNVKVSYFEWKDFKKLEKAK